MDGGEELTGIRGLGPWTIIEQNKGTGRERRSRQTHQDQELRREQTNDDVRRGMADDELLQGFGIDL